MVVEAEDVTDGPSPPAKEPVEARVVEALPSPVDEDVFDPALVGPEPTVTSDDEDGGQSTGMRRQKSLVSFFTGLRRRISSSSLVSSGSSTSSPPTSPRGKDADDEKEKVAKKRRRFRLPKLKTLWRSQSNLRKSSRCIREGAESAGKQDRPRCR